MRLRANPKCYVQTCNIRNEGVQAVDCLTESSIPTTCQTQVSGFTATVIGRVQLAGQVAGIPDAYGGFGAIA
jgi:hypothetical protein